MSDETLPAPPTVAVAIGQFVRRYRAEHNVRRDALARAGTALGMTWGTTSIENIEAGRFAPTLPTLFALCTALSSSSGALSGAGQIKLPDLFDGTERLTLSDGFTVSTERFLHFIGSDEAAPALGEFIDEWARLAADRDPVTPTLAERRAAKRLGVKVDVLRQVSFAIWGESLESVVSASVGSDASAQARGHETRVRVAQLRDHLERNSHG
ncbi:MAG: hypothetical protein PIR02_08770 [Microbacterium enclense]